MVALHASLLERVGRSGNEPWREKEWREGKGLHKEKKVIALLARCFYIGKFLIARSDKIPEDAAKWLLFELFYVRE